MPELVPLWETLTELGGGSDQVARMLSLYQPTPYLAGCSQALWGRGEPMLVRNYDYHPGRCEGLFLLSAWHGTRVIASSDSLWGALDGINEHGLAVTLAFGGRQDRRRGFRHTPRAALHPRVLEDDERGRGGSRARSLPYVLYHRPRGRHGGPRDRAREPGSSRRGARQADLHQSPERRRVARARRADRYTLAREHFLEERIEDPAEGADAFIRRFLKPPVVSTDYGRAFGTLYTAIYWPRRGEAEFRWPNRSWHQSFELFVEGVSVVDYGKGKGVSHEHR